MTSWLVLGALAAFTAGCGKTAGSPGGSGIRDTLDYVAHGISDFYYEHGRLPEGYADIRGKVAPLVLRRSSGEDLTFAWEILRPQGCNPLFPVEAEMRIVGYYVKSNKEFARCDFYVPLARRGKAWFVLTNFVDSERLRVKDDPTNIACALAQAIVEEQERIHRWPRLADLPWESDPVLRDIGGYATTKSFTCRIVKMKSAEAIELSTTLSDKAFLFDPSGLAVAKAPEMIPKNGP